MKNFKMDDEYLAHYASKYYDPIKAHEYYMQHRKLKGRRPTSALSDEGKEVWEYTKDAITTEKKSKIEEEKNKHKQTTQELRDKATQVKSDISEKLKQLNETLRKRAAEEKKQLAQRKKEQLKQLEENAKLQRKNATDKLNNEIDRLQTLDVPDGLSKEDRKKFIADRNKQLYETRKKGREDLSKLTSDTENAKADLIESTSDRNQSISENTRNEISKNTASAREQRAQVSADLKNSIAAAREAYKAAKENIDSSYEEVYQSEYDRIAAEMPNPKARKKR